MAGTRYTPPEVPFRMEGGHVVSEGDVRRRISGTMVAGIIGLSPWSTPFQVACDLLGVATKDISDSPAVKAGQALESVVIDYMQNLYSDSIGSFVPAEELYPKRTGKHADWPSDFEDEIFAGHVDGIVMAYDGNQYILEVKTSSNMESWEQGVPSYYYWQVALYNHFMTKQDKAYVALGVMNPRALKDPTTWVPSKDNAALFEMPIDQKGVEVVLEELRIWYNKYIANGITPDYDPNNPRDVELYKHLCNLTCEASGVQDKVARLYKVRLQISGHESEIAELYAERDELTAQIKDYMSCHEMDRIDSSNGDVYVSLQTSRRSKIDPELMKKDGLNPDKYSVETEVKTFTVKINKEVE